MQVERQQNEEYMRQAVIQAEIERKKQEAEDKRRKDELLQCQNIIKKQIEEKNPQYGAEPDGSK